KYWPPQIRTQKEVLEWLSAEVAKFPQVGSTPKRMPFYGIAGFGGAGSGFPEVKQLALALGDNTTFGAAGKKRELVAHWENPSPEWIKKQEATRKGGFDDLAIVSYGDEIHLPPVALTDAELADWLKARGVAYDGPVKYTTDKKDPLYYYAQIAAKEKGGRKFAEGTAYYKSKGALTGANYFCATPSAVGYTENYIDSYDLAMWKQVHKCTHEAGVFEDYVVDGMVRPAKVGLLLSSVDDLVTGVNNFSLAMHNNERKAIYYALRHAEVPVDFLTEDDVIEGRAKDYATIYVTQQYVHSQCIAALQKWCEAGGTVVA